MIGYDRSGIYKIWDRTKVIRIKNVVFEKKQVSKEGLANLLPYYNNIPITKLLQEPEIVLLELKLQEITKVLKNDGDDNINYSYMPTTFLDTESSNLGNLHIESTSRKSQTCQ